MPENNRIISVMSYGETSRTIRETEMMALVTQPTTQRIKKKCDACGFGTMVIAHDENYKCHYACLKCKAQFS